MAEKPSPPFGDRPLGMPVEPQGDPPPELLHALLARHQGLVALWDPQDRLHWANAPFRATLKLAPDEQPTWAELMRTCHAQGVGTAIDTDDFEHWLASAASRRGKLPYRQFETDMRDGRWLLMTETMSEGGWMLSVGVDISDQGRSHRELRVARDQALRASQEDPLTGAANRTAVLARLAEALANGGPPPWVAVVDLDHFKAVNDHWGHAAGDQVLRDFAQRLRDGLRRADACGRIGGEEFLLVLNDLQATEAQEVVQRLLAAAHQARPVPGQPTLGYSASAGLTQALPGERSEAVLARADRLLYAAKRAGRNRCVRIGNSTA